MTFASPARRTSGSPVQMSLIAAGSEKKTIGSAMRGMRMENAGP